MSNEKKPATTNEAEETPKADDQEKPKKPAVRSKRLTTGLRGGLTGSSSGGDTGGDTQIDTGTSSCHWSCR